MVLHILGLPGYLGEELVRGEDLHGAQENGDDAYEREVYDGPEALLRDGREEGVEREEYDGHGERVCPSGEEYPYEEDGAEEDVRQRPALLKRPYVKCRGKGQEYERQEYEGPFGCGQRIP